MKNFLTAVVPVRKGSQRVKNKNFKKFSKENLLIYKIRVLKKVKNIDEIIINTDSNKAIQIAKDLGVNYFKRNPFYASSQCLNSYFWSNIAKETNSKFIMFTNCTSPMIKKETYNKLVKIFNEKNLVYNSFNTITKMKEFFFYKNRPLNFNPKKAKNSQDLDSVYKLNFAINILSRDLMLNKKTLIGSKPYFYELNEMEGFDINTSFEFKFAEYLFENESN